MSLVVKGMGMPPYEDTFGDSRASVYLCMLNVNANKTASMYCNDLDLCFYSVEEIPKSHGRLIDADKLIAFIAEGLNRSENPLGFDAIEILTEIEHMTVILDAENYI